MDSQNSCDESKCVSKGRSDLYDGSFTCYGDDDGAFYPRMCADGYLPNVVEDEPTMIAPSWYIDGFLLKFDGSVQVPVRYFTCCPPPSRDDNLFSLTQTNRNITRHCSDPIVAKNNKEASNEDFCENRNDNKKLAKKMITAEKKVGEQDITTIKRTHSVLCCDSERDNNHDESYANTPADFFTEIDCVPYRSQSFEPCLATPNQIAHLHETTCLNPESGFIYPRPSPRAEIVDNMLLSGPCQCCKTGPPLAPYVQDSVFFVDTSTQLLVNGVSSILSTIVIIGLLVPLLIKSKRGDMKESPNTSQRSKQSQRYVQPQSSYSTYNLYLVYLAIPDLVWSLEACLHYGKKVNQGVLSEHVLLGVSRFTLFANTWLNVTLLHQLLHLLQSFRTCQRIQQPTIARVSGQTGVIYIFAALSSWGLHYAMNNPILFFGLLYVALFPAIIYGVYVAITVHRRGYIRSLRRSSNAREKAIRELGIYFFRIVTVFVGIWTPAILLSFVGFILGKSWAVFIAALTFAIQPIGTFCVILTKSDAKKYIVDLVTMYGLFKYCNFFGTDDVSKEAVIQTSTNNEKDVTEQTEPASQSLEPNLPRGDLEEESTISDQHDTIPKQSEAHDEEVGGGYSYGSKHVAKHPVAVLATGEIVSR